MKTIHTIIVDDEKRIHRGIERLVRACPGDWEIIGMFSNGIEVIEFLEESGKRIDLMITDVKMPEMDGLALIHEVKKIYRDDSFHSIIISGYDDFQHLQSAIREGASDYLLKPIDRTEFMNLLQRVRDNIYEQRLRSEKWNDLKKKADKHALVKQTQLLSEAVLSGPEDISTLYWIKDFPEGQYQLLYVCADDFPMKTREYKPNDWGIMAYAIQNIIDEMVIHNYVKAGEGNKGWWWRDGGFKFWVLLYGSSRDESSFIASGSRFANDLRSNIHRYTPFTVSIGQSDPFKDLTILPGLRKQLLAYIRFRMVYGGNQVFSSRLTNEMASKDEHTHLSPKLKEMANKMTNALGHSTIPGIEEELNAFFRGVATLRSPSDIQLAIQYIMFNLYKLAMESMDFGYFLPDLDHAIDAIKEETNMIQIKDLVKKIVLQIHHKLLIYEEETVQDPIMKATTWIKDNLHKKISVKDISDQVYMNPTYFCEYFKKQTGITILDYVTDVRLEKAKELLLNTDLKIAEISERMSYQDTKYFSRLFKQKWGKLPSEYKRI
ncbi:response regulator [Paenibacillus validus]|uniref:response regulator transcription factor n=1 Tax=Paenibacillus validus TaxID=44253 RepID=UPI000FDB39FA|nr:helix-turn-helix domain-containing protein [Paenibacillus validus]MED4599810.1 response regulator [Paenibacillus validus]MED4604660.1 response regulator [Paenibacillus validus]